jgi:hypothetical protein
MIYIPGRGCDESSRGVPFLFEVNEPIFKIILTEHERSRVVVSIQCQR